MKTASCTKQGKGAVTIKQTKLVRNKLRSIAKQGGDRHTIDSRAEKKAALQAIVKGIRVVEQHNTELRNSNQNSPDSTAHLLRAKAILYENISESIAIVPDQSSKELFSISITQLPSQISISSGFDDPRRREVLNFSKREWLIILGQDLAQAHNAAQEREAIKAIVARFEICIEKKRILKISDMGGWKGNAQGAGLRSQYDCVDELHNTQQLLFWLTQAGHLKFHQATLGDVSVRIEPAYDRVHLAAVMLDKKGTRWTVDAWQNDGGKKPIVQKESQWGRTCSQKVDAKTKRFEKLIRKIQNTRPITHANIIVFIKEAKDFPGIQLFIIELTKNFNKQLSQERKILLSREILNWINFPQVKQAVSDLIL